MNSPHFRCSSLAAAAFLLVGPAVAQNLHLSPLAVGEAQNVTIGQSFTPFGQRPEVEKVGEDGATLIRDRNGVIVWTNKNGEPIVLPNATLAVPLLVTNTECAVWNNRYFDYDNYAEKPEAEVVIYRRQAGGGTNIVSSSTVPLQGKAVLETSPVTPVTYGFIMVTTERFDNGAESVAVPLIGNPQDVDVWDGIRMRTYRLAWDGTVQRVGTFTGNIPKDGDDPNFDYIGYGSDGSMCYNLRIGVDFVSGVGDATPGYWSDVRTYWIGEDTEIRAVPDITPFPDARQNSDHIRAVFVSNRRLLLVKFEQDRLNFANPLVPTLGADGIVDPDDIISDYRRQTDNSIAFSNRFDYWAPVIANPLALPGGGPQGRILPLSLYSEVESPIFAYSVANTTTLHLYQIGGTVVELGAPVTLPVNIGNAPTFVRNPNDASILLRSESNESGVVWVQTTTVTNPDGTISVTGMVPTPHQLAVSTDGLPLFVSTVEAVIWNNGTADLLGGGVIPPAQISHYHVPDPLFPTVLERNVLTPPIFGNYVLNTPPVTVDPDEQGWFIGTFEKSTANPRTAILRTYKLILGLIDTDGDGLSDADEGVLGTNPLLPDTDGDGLSDGEEMNPFVAVDGLFTWGEARLLAGQQGGRLATPVDAPTQASLASRLSTKPGGLTYWIGGNDLLLEGSQNWVTTAGTISFVGTEASYLNASLTINLGKPQRSILAGMRVYGPGIPTLPVPTVVAVDPTFTVVTISGPTTSAQNLVTVNFAPPMAYTNWALNNPNNFNEADGVQIGVSFGYPWSSRPVATRQGYVVQLAKTNPLLADSDGDGTPDLNDRSIDTDGDGAPDFLEVEELGTDPTIPDYGGGGAPVDLADPALQTSYDGLLYEVGIGVVGKVNLRISRNGALSLSSSSFDDRASGTGTLNPLNGEAGFQLRTGSGRTVFASVVVRRSGIDPTKYTVSGTIGTLTTVQQIFTLQPAAYNKGSNAVEAGNYTFAFLNPGPALATPGMPAGDGVGTSVISRTGQVKSSGYMADGGKFTYSGNILLGKQIAFFVTIGSPPAPSGGAGGNLVFRNIANASDFDGYARFVRKPSYGTTFQAGYDYASQTVGNRWVASGFSNYDEYGINSTPNNAALQFTDGVFDLQEIYVTLDSRGKITTPKTQTRTLSAALSSRNGTVSGRYVFNDPTASYARTTATLNMVALPKLGEMRGQYTGGGESGLLTMVPNAGGSLPPVTQIAPRFQSIPETGLTYKIYVTASEPWRVEIPADVDWLLATPTSGTSSDEVLITVGRNFSALNREATIVIAGLSHSIYQERTTNPTNVGDRSVTINPSFRLVPPDGASYLVVVDADPPILASQFDPLDFISPVGWATVTPLYNVVTQQIIGAQVDVEANPAFVPRFTDVIIAGLPHRIDQEAAVPPPPAP